MELRSDNRRCVVPRSTSPIFGVSPFILDGIMLIGGSCLPSETSGLLAVDICEIQVKLDRFGDNPIYLRA